MDPNDYLRAARSARPSLRRPGYHLSRAELAELVAAEVHRRTGREAPVDAHYVAKLERGVIRWPGADYRVALRAVLGADTDARLGFAPPRREEASDSAAPTADEDALPALAASAEASEVGGAAVDVIEEVVELLARAYTRSAPADLLIEVRRRAAELTALLERRLTLTQRRRLLVVGGWLTLLGATLLVDVGDRRGAATARATARSVARETEEPEIAAWAAEVGVWISLIDQDWHRAARLSTEAVDIAPGTSAAVQLAAQRARAAARVGDAAAVLEALAVAEAGVPYQAGSRPRDHHFVFDERKLDGYTATALAWLGESAAERVTREVADRCVGGSARRLATARIDLGLVLARTGRPDEAAHLGVLALDSGRLVSSNRWRAEELGTVLAPTHGAPGVSRFTRRLNGTAELLEPHRELPRVDLDNMPAGRRKQN